MMFMTSISIHRGAAGLEVSIPEGHALHRAESYYKMVVHCAPKHPHRRCTTESDWRRQENVYIPSFACPSCGNSNMDGTISCFKCEMRLEPHSDVSQALENDRAKRVAARKGEPMDYRALQPRSSVNTNRATGHKRVRSAGSGPAAIKQQAAKYLGKALKSGARTVMERHSKDPFTAYNNARFGISISGLEQLMVFAHMRIANPPRTKKMIEDRTGFEGSAKVCFSFPPEGADLTLTNHCYVAFIDSVESTGSISWMKLPCSPSRCIAMTMSSTFLGSAVVFSNLPALQCKSLPGSSVSFRMRYSMLLNAAKMYRSS